MPLAKLTEPGLRAAMRDPRYWGSYQPEQKSYQDWVTRGWHALAQAEARGGGTVHVRAYTRVRNGRPEQVSAYTQMRSGAGDGTILLVNKPTGGGENKNSRGDPLPDMAGGGLGKVPLSTSRLGGGTSTLNSSGPGESPSVAEIVAPAGKPIGTPRPGSSPNMRGLPGGDEAAREMFSRLTVGRGGVDVTPPTYFAGGRMVQLPDGSRIGYRPGSKTGTPTIDIEVPGLRDIIRRIHFN